MTTLTITKQQLEAALAKNGLFTAAQMCAYGAQERAAERERWQQAAKAVIESHDAALAYVYGRLRSQGVRGITIHDTAAAEIRAVNALRELVQPNVGIERSARSTSSTEPTFRPSARTNSSASVSEAR